MFGFSVFSLNETAGTQFTKAKYDENKQKQITWPWEYIHRFVDIP